jgi:hypothetical protein
MVKGQDTLQFDTHKIKINLYTSVESQIIVKKKLQVAFKDWTTSLLFLSRRYKKLILKFNRPPCSNLSFFAKSVLIKSCSSSEYLSEYKISWSYVDWCKFYIHLKSLNVRHFGMVATTALKLWYRGHLQWHDLPTKFHKNLPLGSDVDWEWGRHTEAGDLISLLFSFT